MTIMTLLLLTSDEGHHNYGVPHQISAEESSMLLVNIAYISNISLTVCSCHVTNAFQSESTLYSCLDVNELLARSRWEI